MFFPKTISKLIQLQEKNKNLKFYLVGGFVRDFINNNIPKDLDVIACGVSDQELYNILKSEGEVQLVGLSFGVYLFKPKQSEEVVQISLPRKEVSTGIGHKDFEVITSKKISLQEDSNRRDFTINSLYLPVTFISTTEVIDFHDGLKDLEEGKVRFVGNPSERIQEDPIRILRYFRMISKGFASIEDSERAIKDFSYLLRYIPYTSYDRIRYEMEEILLSEKPSFILKLMLDLDVLAIIIPELVECVGVTQTKKYHKFDVFTHSILCCDKVPNLLFLRLAALFHDIGKPYVRERRDDRYTFYQHQYVSEEKTREILTRFKFPNKLIEEVCFLVRNHMFNYNSNWTDKSIRKFISKVGITKDASEYLEHLPLFLLRKSDIYSRGIEGDLPKRQKEFEQRIKKVLEKPVPLGVTNLSVNGHDIMQRLNLEPSPMVGKILKYLFDLVISDPSLDKKDILLKKAEDYYSA